MYLTEIKQLKHLISKEVDLIQPHLHAFKGLWVILLFLCFLNFHEAQEKVPKRYIKPGHTSLISKGAKVNLLQKGFGFLEGPISDSEGNIYFTDIPNSKIYIWTINDELELFRSDSGKANGLAFKDNNTLYVCEGGRRRLTQINLNGEEAVIADQYKGKKLNSPNDLWIDPKGGIYFTDPRYGNRHTMELEGEYVFYISPDKTSIVKVVDDLKKPNGILGSLDGKKLYVGDRSGNANYVYDINPDGSLSNKTFFSKEGSDGMTMDSEGNLYITSPSNKPTFHISIYSPQGVKLEEIHTPKKPSNLHFGGKGGKTLFITAQQGLYSVDMRVGGARKKEVTQFQSSDHSIQFKKLWTKKMNQISPDSHLSNNESAEFSPDGKLIAVGCGDATVRVLTVPEGEIVKEIKLAEVVPNTKSKKYEIEVAYWMPDGKQLLAVGNDAIPLTVIDYNSGTVTQKLIGGKNQDALTVSHDGAYAAVAVNDELVIYETKNWAIIKRMKPTNDGDLNSLDFSHDDKYLITGGNKGHVGLITVPNFEVVQDLHRGGGYVKAVRFSPDGNFIARSSHEKYFQLWNLEGKHLKQIEQPDYVEALAFHPNGKYLVVGGKDLHYSPGEYPIKVYRFPELTHLLDIPNLKENVEYLDFSPDGRYMVQPSTTGHVILWEVITTTQQKTGMNQNNEKGRFLHAHKGFKESKTIKLPNSDYTLHQIDRPQPIRVIPSLTCYEAYPPSDAVVIFDGTSMNNFKENHSWKIEHKTLIAGKNFIETKESFGDIQLHLEWRTPNPPRVKQGLGILGNSGIVIMGLYEVQVYDSYTAKIYPDGSAAAIYGQTPPLVNACRAPGEWQSYDIIFKAPKFRNGKLLEPARVTVLHNGVLVQNNTEIIGPTAHRKLKSYQPHSEKKPLALKGENTPVEYRNIWIRDLSNTTNKDS